MFGLSNLKLIAIAVAAAFLIGAPAVAAWKLGGSSVKEAAQAETTRQVTQLRGEYQQLLIAQTTMTDHYRVLADSKYEALIKDLGNIQIVHTTVTHNITQERASDPKFYEQPLPSGGQKQWEAARKLFR